MTETVAEPCCARCGCTQAEHHKLHCEGRDGNCRCSGGWADPGTPLTAFDKVCQDENAEYDAEVARAIAENTGTTIVVPTASHGQVPMHLSGGTRQLTEQDKIALGQLAEAVINRDAALNPHGGVIQELMQASIHSRMALREIGKGDLADRLAAAVHAAREALKGKAS